MFITFKSGSTVKFHKLNKRKLFYYKLCISLKLGMKSLKQFQVKLINVLQLYSTELQLSISNYLYIK